MPITNTPMKPTLSDALQHVVGYALSSVEFVADYVQLHFNGPVLTAYTPPTISWGTESRGWDEPGYRDALCKQIGCPVKRTVVSHEQVSIVFEGGATILISLRDSDYRGPEALQLSLDQEHIWVV